MRSVCWLVLALSICVAALSSTALAQQGGGWFGAEVVDVTKAEANKLGWDAPHGAKVSRIEPGSPAEKAGLKVGDILLLIDRLGIENAADFKVSVEGKHVGTEVRLRVLSGGREMGVAAVLGEQQRVVAAGEAPILQLDTGGHMALVRSVAFSPDGQRILSAGNDKTIRITDRQTGRTVRVIRGQSGLGQDGMLFALAPRGDWVAVGGAIGDIRLFDLTTGKLVGVLKGHTGFVNSLAVSPDGSRLVSGSGLGDLSVIVWDVATKTALHRLRGHKDVIGGVSFTPDGTHVVTAGYDKLVKIWSVKNGKEVATLVGHADKIRALAVSSTGMIASGSYDGEIRLWDGRSRRLIRTLSRPGTIPGALCFDSSGKRLVSGIAKIQASRQPYGAVVWDASTGAQSLLYDEHDNNVGALASSPTS